MFIIIVVKITNLMKKYLIQNRNMSYNFMKSKIYMVLFKKNQDYLDFLLNKQFFRTLYYCNFLQIDLLLFKTFSHKINTKNMANTA